MIMNAKILSSAKKYLIAKIGIDAINDTHNALKYTSYKNFFICNPIILFSINNLANSHMIETNIAVIKTVCGGIPNIKPA